jgi:magnesium chelatase subunit D
MQQALARARQFPAAGLGSLIIDIAVRPAPFATALAVAAGGRYLTLPRADAHGIRAAIGDAQMLRGAA